MYCCLWVANATYVCIISYNIAYTCKCSTIVLDFFDVVCDDVHIGKIWNRRRGIRRREGEILLLFQAYYAQGQIYFHVNIFLIWSIPSTDSQIHNNIYKYTKNKILWAIITHYFHVLFFFWMHARVTNSRGTIRVLF